MQLLLVDSVFVLTGVWGRVSSIFCSVAPTSPVLALRGVSLAGLLLGCLFLDVIDSSLAASRCWLT